MIELLLTDLTDHSAMSPGDQKDADRRVCRAIGQELRAVREARGWSREAMVARLPSGIGDRTLLTYEHGIRQMTLARLVELCQALGVCVGELIERALQKAELGLGVVMLRVDLNEVISRRDKQLAALMPWATNRRVSAPNGIAELHPLAVKELATALGYDTKNLCSLLAEYVPPYDLPTVPREAAVDATDGGAAEPDSGIADRDQSSGRGEKAPPAGEMDDHPALLLDCPLSLEELDLMHLIGSGYTSTEIAQKWDVSAKSIDQHVLRVCEVLKVPSRAKALVTCLDRGWISFTWNDDE